MCKETGMCGGAHKHMKALGLLALRVAIGIIFVYQGYNKLLPGHEGASMFLGSVVGPASWGSFWAYLVGGVEFVGGLMLILGVFANYAAAALAVIMVVAMIVAHPAGSKFNAWFLELAILGGTLALVGTGAGKYRLVKTQCCCKACKNGSGACGPCAPAEKMGGKDGCCGGNCGGCGDKKEEMVK